MVYIIVGDSIFEVPSVYADYSPYIVANVDWNKNLHVMPMDIDGVVTTDYIVIDDIPEHRVGNYVQFLVGGDFTMTPVDEYIFGLFGHPNTYGYPLNYWKVKLRNMWIRHFMKVVPIDIPVNKSIPMVRVPATNGIIGRVYTSPLIALHAAGLDVRSDQLGYTNMPHPTWYTVSYTNALDGVVTISNLHVIPSDIDPVDFIYSQDVDVMQVTLVMQDGHEPIIYATDLAVYALEMKTTYLDPSMPISSLPKYSHISRHFTPWIPYTTSENILPIPYPPYMHSLVNVLSDRDVVEMMVRDDGEGLLSYDRLIIPKDLGSIILMIGYYGLHSYALVDDMLSHLHTPSMEPFRPILEASPLYNPGIPALEEMETTE